MVETSLKRLPKAPLARCYECPLQNERHVNGKGPSQADLVVVGEAPGREEVNTGVPFTGRSGRLLDSILEREGFRREDIYYTNTVLCRPPDNRTPTSDEIKACRDRLVAEIKGRQPKTVLLLGNTAAQTLLDTRTGITALRTDPSPESPFIEANVVPTFHPAAALRQGDLLPSILRDVSKVNRIGTITWEHTKYKVASTVDEGLHLLMEQQRWGNDNILSLDVEIDIELEDFKKRNDARNPQFLCSAISHRPGASVVYTKEVVESLAWQDLLDQLFRKSDKKWLYQNGKFDIQQLWGLGVPHARVDEDTMLAHYVTDERKGTHDLEQLAVEILNAPRYKTDTRQYLPRKGASLAYLPPDILYQYNAADADVTHRLVEPLVKEMESDGVTRPYRELLIPGTDPLARAEYIGAKVDVDELDKLDEELSGHLGELESILARWVGNPRSPKQVKEAFLELAVHTATTDKEFLEKIKTRGGEVKEFAEQLLEYRRQHKLHGTYVRGMAKRLVRQRLHPTFLLHGTETGRLSCRQPNLQNIPTGSTIRDIFVAGPDNVLLNADYSQIEFVLLAVLSGDEWLLDQFRQGRKFHHEMAVSLFGEHYTGLQYLRAKAVNFGIPYGREAPSLFAEHGGSLAQWQVYVRDWFARAPKVKEYQKDIERQIREQSYLESHFGRKRRFWLVTRDNWNFIKKEGYNFPLQSTASDFTLQSLIRLEPLLRGKATPIITVHDNLMWEVRKQYLEEVIHTVKEVMEDTPVRDICPTRVEIKVGQRWGSHRKGECPNSVCDHLQEVA